MSSTVYAGWSWSVDGEEWAHLWREVGTDPLLGPADAAQAAVATGEVPMGTPFLVTMAGDWGYPWDDGGRYTYLLTDDGLFTKVGAP